MGLQAGLFDSSAGRNHRRAEQILRAGLAQYGSEWQYFAPDRLGSVRQIVDPAGQLLLAQSFDPFGNVLVQGGEGNSAFGYTGEQVDSTELVYLRARYYQPEVGRFLTPDTIIPDPLRSQSWNRFAYVENNPIRYVDPSGHQGCALLAGRPGVGMPVKCIPEGGMVGKAAVDAITIGVGVGLATGVLEFPTVPPGAFSQDTTYPVGNICSEPGLLSGAPPVELPSFFPGPILETQPPNTTLEFPLLQPGETGSNILFIERKQALKIMKGLSIQIEIHLRKIANEPDSQAAEHWRSEVDNWINDIERLSAHVGKKTQAEWAEVIENWRSRLGD